MSRSVTLFTGQWADLPIAELLPKVKSFGYDGVELACWGDHFEVESADEAYCRGRRELLEQNGLTCGAVSSHLVGQAVCDLIDARHQTILPASIWGDGEPEGVRQRAAGFMIKAGEAAKRFGVEIVNGFTGSSIWHLVYSFPPVLPGQIEGGYKDFAKRWKPILDAYQDLGVKFALEVHPTEIAFDIASARRAIEALDGHPAFGFNYDPSHFAYQGVDYERFLYEFSDRIFHVHMKDVGWRESAGPVGVFGGHVDFHHPDRYWDFRSLGRGNVRFEPIIRALNHIGYRGPLSVEWEDGGMDREFGATEACAYVRKIDFPSSGIVFDAQFAADE